MIRAYDDNGNVVDLVEWEEEIRAGERERIVKEIAKASLSKELNENIDYCMKTIILCKMTKETRKELCETLLSQRAMLTEFEKQIRAKTIDEFVEYVKQYMWWSTQADEKVIGEFALEEYASVFKNKLKEQKNE